VNPDSNLNTNREAGIQKRERLARAALVFLLVCVGARAQETTSVWTGVYTEEQAMRGEMVYRTYCIACHGPELEGADMTPPLSGGAFMANWNDLTAGDLFERIRLTMPLDRPGVLMRQQNADVIAFVLKKNGWPAGSTELSRELAPLKTIRIESVRPDAHK
jgi:mono/diheme cytochrome c family protein